MVKDEKFAPGAPCLYRKKVKMLTFTISYQFPRNFKEEKKNNEKRKDIKNKGKCTLSLSLFVVYIEESKNYKSN